MKALLRISKLVAVFATLAIFFSSCQSVDVSKMTDAELVAAGTEAWNTARPTDAQPYWNAIKDPKTKERYVKYLSDLEVFEKDIADLETKAADPKVKVAKDVDGLLKRYKSFQKDLKVPPVYREDLLKLAVRGVDENVEAGNLAAANELIKNTETVTETQEAFDSYRTIIASYNKIAAQEANAAKQAAAAKDVEDFNDRITAYEAAIDTYAKVEASASAENKRLGLDEDSAIAALSTKIRKKRGDTRVEMERQLRDRQYTFKERIGEVFARQPDPDKVGKMKPEDILAFNEETRTQINDLYVEIVDFGKKYPKVIDQDMINDVAAQKASLDTRIAIITKEIKTARDIESRGKAALPLMIGLFNPQPSTKAEEKKSRPAKLKGTVTGEADYWWGMLSIDNGAMNDLVVTMADNREVAIYADNTLSGTQVEAKKLKNLVNKQYKVGNSWPVINAGSQLPKSQYYIELKKGSKPQYTGEVVIYNSFISRMR